MAEALTDEIAKLRAECSQLTRGPVNPAAMMVKGPALFVRMLSALLQLTGRVDELAARIAAIESQVSDRGNDDA